MCVCERAIYCTHPHLSLYSPFRVHKDPIMEKQTLIYATKCCQSTSDQMNCNLLGPYYFPSTVLSSIVEMRENKKKPLPIGRGKKIMRDTH